MSSQTPLTKTQAKCLKTKTRDALITLEGSIRAIDQDLLSVLSPMEGEPVPTREDLLRLVKAMQEAVQEIQETVQETK